jgi:hypothetical protein
MVEAGYVDGASQPAGQQSKGHGDGGVGVRSGHGARFAHRNCCGNGLTLTLELTRRYGASSSWPPGDPGVNNEDSWRSPLGSLRRVRPG